MKHLVLLLFVLSSVSLFSQKMPENCNGLPYIKVDEKASLKSDLGEDIGVELPSRMKKGNFTATYKCFVNCKGEMEKHTYQDGNLTEEEQNWLGGILGKAEWKGAVKDGAFVTSTVFLQIEISNGKVKVTIA